jgi:uncharacterized protein
VRKTVTDGDRQGTGNGRASMTRLTVWVQPRASRTEVSGWHGEILKIRLAAPPVEGAANEELVRFVAEKLGVAKRAVRVVGGLTARKKTLEVQGVDERRVETLLVG